MVNTSKQHENNHVIWHWPANLKNSNIYLFEKLRITSYLQAGKFWHRHSTFQIQNWNKRKHYKTYPAPERPVAPQRIRSSSHREPLSSTKCFQQNTTGLLARSFRTVRPTLGRPADGSSQRVAKLWRKAWAICFVDFFL